MPTPSLFRRAARRALLPLLMLAALLPLAAAPAAAQDAVRAAPATADAVQPCTYDACALRVEDGWFGRRVVRGPEGTLVARLGLGGPRLENIVVGSDSAVYHARLYQRAENTGAVLTLIGTIGSIASFIAYTQRDADDDLRDEVVAVNLSALALGVVGTTFQLRARRELSRALWWHNRAVLERR